MLPDCSASNHLSEIRDSLAAFLSTPAPKEGRALARAKDGSQRIRRFGTTLIAALGGDLGEKGESRTPQEGDGQPETATHDTSDTSPGHAPWPEPNESPASFIGQALLLYHQYLSMLNALVWLGHPDPLSVVVQDACDCCGEPIDLYQAIEITKGHLHEALGRIEVDEEDIDTFLAFHDCLLRYAQGDHSRALVAELGVLRRRVYVIGRCLFYKCMASFCSLCRESYEQRRSRVRSLAPDGLRMRRAAKPNFLSNHQ